MSNFEQESKYEKTAEYIYVTAAKRLKERKRSLNLTDSEIAGDYDRKVISRIMNNTRTRNNVYLIPPAYTPLLVRELGFANDAELFWGNVEDEVYIEGLFCNLFLDILDQWEDDDDFDRAKLAKDILIDDVTYAKFAANITSIENVTPEGDYLPFSPIAYLNKDAQYSLEDHHKIRFDAILRLYKNTLPIEIFKDFFEEKNSHGENKGFSKLDKRLEEFTTKRFMPFLKKNMPSEKSLGLRVYSIAKTDIASYVELEFTNASIINDGTGGCTDPEYNEVLQVLVAAGKDYIEQIEKIQHRLDKVHRKSISPQIFRNI